MTRWNADCICRAISDQNGVSWIDIVMTLTWVVDLPACTLRAAASSALKSNVTSSSSAQCRLGFKHAAMIYYKTFAEMLCFSRRRRRSTLFLAYDFPLRLVYLSKIGRAFWRKTDTAKANKRRSPSRTEVTTIVWRWKSSPEKTFHSSWTLGWDQSALIAHLLNLVHEFGPVQEGKHGLLDSEDLLILVLSSRSETDFFEALRDHTSVFRIQRFIFPMITVFLYRSGQYYIMCEREWRASYQNGSLPPILESWFVKELKKKKTLCFSKIEVIARAPCDVVAETETVALLALFRLWAKLAEWFMTPVSGRTTCEKLARVKLTPLSANCMVLPPAFCRKWKSSRTIAYQSRKFARQADWVIRKFSCL